MTPTTYDRLTELAAEVKRSTPMAAHRILALEEELDELRSGVPGRHCSTYEWLCGECGHRTWLDYAGGILSCDCPKLDSAHKFDEPYPERDKRAANTHVWLMRGANREYLGTAHSLARGGPMPVEPTLNITVVPAP